VAFARVSQPRTRNGVLAADLTVSSLFPWAGNVKLMVFQEVCHFREGEQLSFISIISADTVTSDKTPRLLPQCGNAARRRRSLLSILDPLAA
jgi:hypothetical protein